MENKVDNNLFYPIDKAIEAVQLRHRLEIDSLLDHEPAQLRLAE